MSEWIAGQAGRRDPAKETGMRIAARVAIDRVVDLLDQVLE
jgi:hypothetical protein